MFIYNKPHPMRTLLLLTGCSLIVACSSTKITSTPHAGYRMHEHMVIVPLPDFSEVENERMMNLAIESLSKELIFLNIVPYQDAVYKTSQFGLTLPTFNRYDTAQLGMLHRQANIQYILTSDLVSVKSETTDKTSPDYEHVKAVMSFQLLDAIHKTIVWRCTVRFTANPVALGPEKEDLLNLRTESFAVHKAYHKGMKRLTKNFELMPNRPKVINK